jgi:phosphopantetheinyl transferase
LFKKVATDSEWNLVDQDEYELFFRYWTAKEATLKATTAGIRDLSKCRVAQILDADHLIVDYQDKAWHIEHLFFDGHVASVVTYDMEVEWTLL